MLHEQPSDQVKAEMDKFGKEVEDLKKNGEDEVKSLTELSQNIIQLVSNHDLSSVIVTLILNIGIQLDLHLRGAEIYVH